MNLITLSEMYAEIKTYKIHVVDKTHLNWVSMYRIRDGYVTALAFFEVSFEPISECDAVVKSTEVEVDLKKIDLKPDDTIDDILKSIYRTFAA